MKSQAARALSAERFNTPPTRTAPACSHKRASVRAARPQPMMFSSIMQSVSQRTHIYIMPTRNAFNSAATLGKTPENS
jgi:hypothetical protein